MKCSNDGLHVMCMQDSDFIPWREVFVNQFLTVNKVAVLLRKVKVSANNLHCVRTTSTKVTKTCLSLPSLTLFFGQLSSYLVGAQCAGFLYRSTAGNLSISRRYNNRLILLVACRPRFRFFSVLFA